MQVRDQIVNSAKGLVKTLGWHDKVLSLACSQANLSSASGRGLFPNGIVEIAEILMKDWENQLSLDVKLGDLDNKTLNEQIFLALKKRLSYEVPYMPLWKDAIYLGALPHNLPITYNRLFSTMNTVWDMIGDNSTGVNWYSKRVLIGQIFISTEMMMIHDGSIGLTQTWNFLHRQLHDQNFDNIQDLGYLWYKYTKSVFT
ncbi:hypothetical protein SteCoe_2745 [Stentor coeruleus]|uniref:Ubiquinone biosynthesis protein n=1 Tax=Stentor coeruleus TaxID=5963 RepID=A0A1R2CYM8_9CILI|nr:hypothetical protein SteCoe_2745 [Stentor coeruleus]